jgi:DtxR family Mn-dependent transcriptional regulator
MWMRDQTEALPLSSMRTGQEGHVAYVGTKDHRRLEQLSSLGIVPGAALHLLQNRLAAVVRVGETEVALDFDIARLIYVWPGARRRTRRRGR